MSMAQSYKTIAVNRRSRHDYEIKDKLMAGIVLQGHEVKSVRAGHVQLKGAYVQFIHGELWLVNAHISAYPTASLSGYQPTRPRKLLVHKRELEQFAGARQSGQVLAVLSIGLSGRLIKVELGVGRGRKLHDKRERIKRREADLEAAKAIKRRAG